MCYTLTISSGTIVSILLGSRWLDTQTCGKLTIFIQNQTELVN